MQHRAANELTAGEYAKLRQGQGRGRNWMPRRPAAERTEDGIAFSSKAELKRYRELKAMRSVGEILWFCRQPTFDLGGVRYRPDFLVYWPEAGAIVEEVKGKGAPPEVIRRFRRNAKQMLHLLGIEVELVLR